MGAIGAIRAVLYRKGKNKERKGREEGDFSFFRKKRNSSFSSFANLLFLCG
jgi:hypothetical protein